MLIIEAAFWIFVSLIVYAYVGYPLTVWAAARLFGGLPTRPWLDAAEFPFVSILIAAHNEEAVIAERLRNALAVDYPADRLEIVVASDGSTDRTTETRRRLPGSTRPAAALATTARQGASAECCAEGAPWRDRAPLRRQHLHRVQRAQANRALVRRQCNRSGLRAAGADRRRKAAPTATACTGATRHS